MSYEEMRDVAEFMQLAMRPGGTGNAFTAKERRIARELWGRLSGAMESKLNTEEKLLNISEQIQNYFYMIGYMKGFKKVEDVLAKHDKATMIDFSNIRFLLHNFWEDKHELREELSFDWMENQHHLYQPIYGYELEYMIKGKYTKKRYKQFLQTLTYLYRWINNWSDRENARVRILDIGSAFGWFPFNFNEVGMEAVGVEVDVDRFLASRAIKHRIDLKTDDYPRFYCSDGPTWVLENNYGKERQSFDYVIMLHTFHHILANDYDYHPKQEERGWRMFNKLLKDGAEIFVSMDGHWQGWELKYKRNIPRSILEQSDATKATKVGEPIRGRQLYLYS